MSLFPTPEMIEAAKAKGREIAGNQPGALVEAFAEVAEAGAVAALALVPGEPVAQMYEGGDGFGLRQIWFGALPPSGSQLFAAPASQPVSAKALPDLSFLHTMPRELLEVVVSQLSEDQLSTLRCFLYPASPSPFAEIEALRVENGDQIAKLREYFLAAEDVFEFGEAQAPTRMIRRLHSSRAALQQQGEGK